MSSHKRKILFKEISDIPLPPGGSIYRFDLFKFLKLGCKGVSLTLCCGMRCEKGLIDKNMRGRGIKNDRRVSFQQLRKREP